jgi:hypothetical protein
VFAPKALAALAGSKAASDLIMERRRRLPDENMQRNFKRFLLVSTERQRWHREEPADYFVKRFCETSNDVALKTVEQNAEFPASTYA